MACTTNNTVKPDVVQRPNNLYGAPQGQGGRVFNSVDYGVQGIILHCTDMTISQYVQYLACLTQPVAGVNQETNHHYSIGSAGALNQHIDDGNISWTFGNYTATVYVTPPSPTILIDWPALQTINGTNVSQDVYVINILIAKSYNQSTTCLTSSGLPADQHEKLIQLLAYLAATYDIPLDADHINWHDNIATQACPSNECSCSDIACLLTDINTFCEEDCNTITYSEVNCADVSHLLATPSNCGNASGCLVTIPFDACCFGHLADEGDIDIFLGLSSTSNDPCATDAEYCLVKNFINVTAPLTGQGTADDPLALDLCLFGNWVPQVTDPTEYEAVNWILGIDDEGCLVQMDLAAVVAANETPITVIDTNSVDLTASGDSNHTIQADVKISTLPDNLITIESDGLFVGFNCDNFKGLFEEDTLQYIYGVDAQGECAFEDINTAIERIICDQSVSDGTYLPLHILGRNDNMDCPEFFTPVQVVMAGLTVIDTPSVDLTLTDGELSANVIVDPASNNTVSISSSGVYVPELTVTALDDCIDVSIIDNSMTIGINVDPMADNILSCQPGGLYVQDINPINTDCISLIYDANTRTLSAEIIFSGTIDDVPNVASCESTGFYVPQGANIAILGPLVGEGNDNNPLDINFSLLDNQDLCDFGGVIPTTLSLVTVVGRDATGCLRQYTGEEFIAQFLEIDNGDCITATLTDNVLNIEPVISPPIGALNNVLFCTPTGLYVPLGAGIVPQATNCIDLQLVNGVLTATPIIDPDLLNQLSCNVDGLYVERGAGVIGGTTDCIQVVAVNGEVTATPIISPTILGVANTLTCEPGGLFVPTGAGLVPVTSDCLTVTFDTATGELSVEPIISPLVDNILQCTVNGLYVPDDFITSVEATECITLDVTGGALTATPVIDPDTDNLLECTANGLFANFAILDTSCIDLTLNNGILSAEPIIDPASANLLTCGVDGLLVELNSNVFIDSDCIDFDVTNGLVTANPILAPDQGPITNILRCIAGQGLYVPVGGGITTLNGNCVELDLVAGVLTADVIIDTVQLDNQVTCGPDGLYVPVAAGLQVLDTDCVNLDITPGGVLSSTITFAPVQGGVGNVATCIPGQGFYVPQGAGLVGFDTNCISISVAPNGVVSANPIIDPDPDNQLQCRANGFFVDDCCPQVIDTLTVDLTLTGDNIISADVIIDPDGTNILVSNPNGLYVPPDFIQNIVDSQCIDIDVTNGILTVNPIISAQPNNIIQCLGDGLFAQAPVVTVSSTDCIDLILNSGNLTAVPIIDSALDNQLQCLPTGLYVSEPFITSVIDTDCLDLDVTNGVLTATVIVDPAADNQLTCGAGTGLYVPPIVVIDTNCIDLDLTNNVLTANPILSPTADNALDCLGDGLYVPQGANLQAVDTDCIAMDVTAGVVSATPIISAIVNNQLSCEADGLFVAPAPILFVTNSDCIDLSIVNSTLEAEISISGDTGNQITCLGDGLFVPLAAGLTALDTNCIDMDVTNGVVSANPIISGSIGGVANALTCEATGLYVPEDFIQAVLSTDCITLDVTNGVLSVTPIVSLLPDNQLVCQGDGLYVPVLTVVDTNCIDLDVTAGVLTANPIISATADNALQCLADGFYVPECCPLVTDTLSVDLTLTGTRTISADVIIDPAIDNQLVLNPDGLFVAEPFITSIVDTDCIDIDVTGGVLTATAIIDPAADNRLVCQGTGLYVPPLTIVDGNCIDLTLVGDTLTAEAIISAQINNIVQCLGDGLFAEAPVRTVADTNCIDLTLNAGELTAVPIIDPALDNQLQCLATGLYVPEPLVMAVADTQCIDLDVTGGVLTANPIIDPAATNLLTCGANGLLIEHVITVVDGNCIDLELTGDVLTAEVIVSTQADNAVQCLGDGLYVPDCCPLVVDTQSVDLTLTGTRTISADVIIDPDVTNALVLNPNGLYAPEAFITAVADTNCISPTVTAGVLTVDPIIDPAADNLLICQGTGLYVPPMTVVDTDCIDLDITGNVLTASVIIDPAVDNQVVCQGTGLYVPPITVVDTNCIDLDLTGNVLTANPIISAIVDNQVDCIGDGFYVPQAAGLEVLDTNCIDLTITAGVLSADPIISAIADNIITCEADGLYVPADFIQAVNDTNCIALDVTGNVLTANPIIDPAATNLLTCGANGLLIEHIITVVDSNCIDLDLTGDVLTADVIISAQANNIVQCLGDGLFAEAPVITVADTDCITLILTAGQLTAEPIIDPNIDNQLQCLATGLFVDEPFVTAVNDTNCVALDVTGGVLTANPIISATADNQLTCIGDGLYVPAGAGIVGDDTDCISVDVTAGVVTATPIISGAIGGIPNTLTCEATGLYVPELQIDDTDCIDLDYTGGVLTANPILAPDQGGVSNVLTCLPDGLYVPAGAGLTELDGNCIDLTITNGNIITADIVVDPLVDNQLVCNAAGLYVPPINVIDSNCIDLEIVGGALFADIIIAPAQGGFTNITECLADGLFTPETVLTRNVGAAASGGNTIDVDTDGDNIADFTFCEGICEVLSTNDCVDGGVGAGYMLTEFDIVDQTLTINSAPEHFTVTETASIQGVAGGDTGHPAAPGFTQVTHDTEPCVTMVNPSPCREMIVQITAVGDFNANGWTVNDPADPRWIMGLVIRDGPGGTNLGIAGARNGNGDPLTPGLNHNLNSTAVAEFTIPPGGVQDFCTNITSSIWSDNGFDTSSVRISITAHGSTT